MKRVHLILLALFAAVSLQAQSVLGIKFGSSYQEVYDALKERVKSYEISETDGNIELHSIEMGEVKFNYARFSFQRSGKSSFFNAAHFEKHYPLDDVEDAKFERDHLWSLIKEKYADDWADDNLINRQGFRFYAFGRNPQDKNEILGFIFLIRSKGKDGKERLYLSLDYGPIYYLDKASDF